MYKWNVNNQKSQLAMNAMAIEINKPYHGENHNCLTITKAGLNAADVYCEDFEWRPVQATEMRRNAQDETWRLKRIQE